MYTNHHLYDNTYFQPQLSINHFVEKPCSYQVLEKAFIVPEKDNHGGVYTSQKEFITSTGLHDGLNKALEEDAFAGAKVVEETVVYLGDIYRIWGHCITDCLKYMWFLLSEDFQSKFKDCRLVYISPDGAMADHFADILKKINVCKGGQKFTLVEETTQFAKVVLPDQCWYSDENGSVRYFTPEYRALIGNIKQYQQDHFIEDKKYEKVYVTYSRYYKGKSVGEDKLERFFAAQGYTIVAPEDFTFDEQLNIYANCKHFASTVGSCSHNLIFLQEHANVILIPRAYYLTGYQTALDQVVDLNITYVDASLSVLVEHNCPWNGPFYYYVSEQLLECFGQVHLADAAHWKKQLRDLNKYLRKWKLSRYDKAAAIWCPEYYQKQFAYCVGKYRQGNKIMALVAKVLRKVFKS